MPKPTAPQYNTPLLVIGIVLAWCTGGFWLLPMGLHYISSAVHGRPPNPLVTTVHTFLTMCTLGFYLLPLAGWYLFKSSKK